MCGESEKGALFVDYSVRYQQCGTRSVHSFQETEIMSKSGVPRSSQYWLLNCNYNHLLAAYNHAITKPTLYFIWDFRPRFLFIRRIVVGNSIKVHHGRQCRWISKECQTSWPTNVVRLEIINSYLCCYWFFLYVNFVKMMRGFKFK